MRRAQTNPAVGNETIGYHTVAWNVIDPWMSVDTTVLPSQPAITTSSTSISMTEVERFYNAISDAPHITAADLEHAYEQIYGIKKKTRKKKETINDYNKRQQLKRYDKHSDRESIPRRDRMEAPETQQVYYSHTLSGEPLHSGIQLAVDPGSVEPSPFQ